MTEKECWRCGGTGEELIEEHLGEGVYSVVDSIRCRRCRGTGKITE